VSAQGQPGVGLPMTVSYASTVRRIELKTRAVRVAKDDSGEFFTERETLGWGILLEGESEWKIFPERPPLEVGDRVRVVIEKV